MYIPVQILKAALQKKNQSIFHQAVHRGTSVLFVGFLLYQEDDQGELCL